KGTRRSGSAHIATCQLIGRRSAECLPAEAQARARCGPGAGQVWARCGPDPLSVCCRGDRRCQTETDAERAERNLLTSSLTFSHVSQSLSLHLSFPLSLSHSLPLSVAFSPSYSLSPTVIQQASQRCGQCGNVEMLTLQASS